MTEHFAYFSEHPDAGRWTVTGSGAERSTMRDADHDCLKQPSLFRAHEETADGVLTKVACTSCGRVWKAKKLNAKERSELAAYLAEIRDS